MLPSMDLDEYVNFVRQVDKALILRSLGIAIVLLVAIQFRKVLTTRAKVRLRHLILSYPHRITAKSHSHCWVIWYHHVLDRCFQIRSPRKGNYSSWPSNGVDLFSPLLWRINSLRIVRWISVQSAFARQMDGRGQRAREDKRHPKVLD